MSKPLTFSGNKERTPKDKNLLAAVKELNKVTSERDRMQSELESLKRERAMLVEGILKIIDGYYSNASPHLSRAERTDQWIL